MTIRVDTSKIDRLAADIGRASFAATGEAVKVLTKAAANIKDQMRDEASGHKRFPAFPRSISYDIDAGFGGKVSAVIGPDKDRPQGALANILYFGTSRDAPTLDIEGPLRAEAPRFERALGDAVEQLYRS